MTMKQEFEVIRKTVYYVAKRYYNYDRKEVAVKSAELLSSKGINVLNIPYLQDRWYECLDKYAA